MQRTIVIIAFTLIISSAFAQTDAINQRDTNSLKVGHWKIRISTFPDTVFYEGNFKVVDTSLEYSNDNLRNISFVSVRDGRWVKSIIEPDGHNKIICIDDYKNGCMYRHEDLQPHPYPYSLFFKTIETYRDSLKIIDIEVDSLKLVFKRSSYSGKFSETIFYPTANVRVKNAEFKAEALFTKPDTIYIAFTAKDTSLITAVRSSCNQLVFVNENASAPIYLLPGHKDSIGVVYAPDRNNLQHKAIVTVKVNNDYLNFYFYLCAYDISCKNINDVESIHLRKTDSLKLYIFCGYWWAAWGLFEKPIEELRYLM